MSERPRDDEELQAFLSRESGLSRRYRESGDEQPPAHVDDAILAASRWAVGADRNRRTGRTSGSHYGASPQSGTRWRRSIVARWSVPLAMAAVVVVAVTLTIMIEREPELDRIDQRYDTPAPAEGEALRERAIAEAELPPPQTPAPAGKAVLPGVTSQPSEPAAALPLAKNRRAETVPIATSAPKVAPSPVKKSVKKEPAQDSPAAQDETEQPLREDRLAARERNEPLEAQVAVEQLVTRDAPATLAQPQLTEKMVPAQTPAEPFPEGISAEIKAAETDEADVASLDELASVDQLRDESGFTGASVPPKQQEALHSAVTTPGQQQSPAPETRAMPQTDSEFAGSERSTEIVEAESVRDAAQWIEDIEKLLSEGKRAEAIDSLEAFRLEYPGYELPPNLLSLLPSASDE